MERKHKTRRETERSTTARLWSRTPLRPLVIVGGILTLIGALLLVRARQCPAASAQPAAMDTATAVERVEVGSTVQAASASSLPATPQATDEAKLTILPAPSPTPDLLPEAQLSRLMQAGQPVFLFFHSDTCPQCETMKDIVEEVYPDFSGSVALMDVDVYDGRNTNLVQQADVRGIPTLMFVDREGEVTRHVGEMDAAAFRKQLRHMR